MCVVGACSAERKPVEPALRSRRRLFLFGEERSLFAALRFNSDDGRLSAGDLLFDAELASSAICIRVV